MSTKHSIPYVQEAIERSETIDLYNGNILLVGQVQITEIEFTSLARGFKSSTGFTQNEAFRNIMDSIFTNDLRIVGLAKDIISESLFASCEIGKCAKFANSAKPVIFDHPYDVNSMANVIRDYISKGGTSYKSNVITLDNPVPVTPSTTTLNIYILINRFDLICTTNQ